MSFLSAAGNVTLGILTAPLVVPAAVIGGGVRDLAKEPGPEHISDTFSGWFNLIRGGGNGPTIHERIQHVAQSDVGEVSVGLGNGAATATGAVLRPVGAAIGGVARGAGEAAGGAAAQAVEGAFKGLGAGIKNGLSGGGKVVAVVAAVAVVAVLATGARHRIGGRSA